MAQDWDEIKRAAQSAFADVTHAYYQDILRHGHLLPNRTVERESVEAEYQLDHEEYNQYLDETRQDIPEPEPEDLGQK